MKILKIGTRGSSLALWQANYVKRELSKFLLDIPIEIVPIKTTGDWFMTKNLSDIGGKGVFVKEIEHALLEKDIDIAVHSMKDLPSFLPDGLEIGAVLKRDIPNDVLISRDGCGLVDLPDGARVGTGSLRRGFQLVKISSHIKIVPIRGNIDTRLKKLRSGEYDAVVLSGAGLQRLGLFDMVTECFDTRRVVPAPGQGIIAVECRSEDTTLKKALLHVNHKETELASRVERSFLYRLSGDCSIPLGCFANVCGDIITAIGIIGTPDGSVVVREEMEGYRSFPEALGYQIADSLLRRGGERIIKSLN